jgi:hypothetical protein
MTDVRAALTALADDAARRAVRPPAADLHRRATRRRVRALTAAAAAAVVAVAAGAVALDRGSHGLRPPVTTQPPTQPAPEPTATASPRPSPTQPAAPSTIVAGPDYGMYEGGPVAVLSAATGRVVRRLGDRRTGSAVVPVLSADRRTVYFTRVRSACRHEILAVPVAGGAERHVADGMRPAISPDGRRLAYFVDTGTCDEVDQVVVRDLATGAERRWTRDGPRHYLGEVTWAPDSRHLAVVTENGPPLEEADPDIGSTESTDVYVVDTDLPGGAVSDGRRMPGMPTDGYLVDAVLYRGPAGALVLLERRMGNDPSRLVQVDPGTGRRKVLVRFAGDVSGADYDASGRYLLHVTPGGTLYRWTDGEPVVVARDIHAAAW